MKKTSKYTLMMAPLLALLVSACSTTPSQFYALSAVAPTNAMTIKQQAKPLQVLVGTITLPDLVDRPQMVIQQEGHEVKIYETQRWANSLKHDLPRVLAQDIAMRLPVEARVAAFPQFVVPDPAYTVQLDVQRFESQIGKAAIIEALWTVRREKPEQYFSGSSRITEAVTEDGLDALVAAHSRALATLSTQIAKTIETDLARKAQ